MGRFLMRAPKRAVAPVVGTILMVAITIVLAAVVFYLVSNMLAPPPPTPVAISFERGTWVNGNHTASVVSSTGAGSIKASDVTYVVKDVDGTPYYSGEAEDTQTTLFNNGTLTVTVTVHFTDIGGDDRITASDRLSIEVSPISTAAALEGGVVELSYGGRQIATHGL